MAAKKQVKAKPGKLKTLFSSRRFYAALGSAAIVFFQDYLHLSPDQATLLVYTVGAWVVGDSLHKTE